MRYELRVLVDLKRAHMWSPKVNPRIAATVSTGCPWGVHGVSTAAFCHTYKLILTILELMDLSSNQHVNKT